MQSVNPTFILRNWILQDAIEVATKPTDDYSRVRLLLKLSYQPFNQSLSRYIQDEQLLQRKPDNIKDHESSVEDETLITKYISRPPSSAASLICTCSS